MKDLILFLGDEDCINAFFRIKLYYEEFINTFLHDSFCLFLFLIEYSKMLPSEDNFYKYFLYEILKVSVLWNLVVLNILLKIWHYCESSISFNENKTK